MTTSVHSIEEDVTIDEATARFPGRWILLQVTERDAGHIPVRGRVLVTGSSRRSIQATVLQKMAESRETGAEYYIFGGFRRIRTGSEWAAALDVLVGQGTRRARTRR